MRASEPTSVRAGFTLVELILVMALIATLAALSVPLLSNSLRQRYLDQEGTRFLALIEYGRNEAVSQGIPMTVYLDPEARRFGVQPKTGYAGVEARQRDFALSPDVQLEVAGSVKAGIIKAVEFSPEGAPSTASAESVNLTDRFGGALSIVRTADRWGYEIAKEAQ